MATRYGLEKWHPDFFDRFETATVFDLLVGYLKSGRIRVDKSVNNIRAAYHDPCNYGRKSQELFGKGYYDEPRWVMDQCMREWVDLFPARGNQYCCGGGGGTLLTPFKDERTHYGRKKMEQIRRAGVELIVVPCHSCHGQIKAMAAAYDMPDLMVKYLWEVVADALIVDAG
jgi:dimethylglycine catabolism B